MMEIRTKVRGIDLLVKLDNKIPETIVTDPRRLKQILVNLIGNAVKFTFEGFVKISAKHTRIKGEDGIEISIQDTGLGIKQQD